MDPMLWYVGITLTVAVAINVLGSDIQQYLYRDKRIKKCTGNARDNVRIVHTAIPGKTYKPTELEPLSEKKWKLVANATQPNYEQITMEVTRKQLKSDLIATIQNGKSDIRYIPEDMLSAEHAENDMLYTGAEEKYIIESSKNRITELEGEITALKANHRTDIEDAVRHAADLARSGKAPTTQRR